MSIITNLHKITIDHMNGHFVTFYIDNSEFTQIMHILLRKSIHLSSSKNDIHQSLPIPTKLEEKNLHNDSLSSNDGNEVRQEKS